MENKKMTSVQLIADSYTSYHRSVYLYICYRINNKEEAEDIAQDVFLRLMDYKQMLRPDTVKFFIYTISRNLVNDYLRRHYKKQEITSYIYDHATTCTNETENQIYWLVRSANCALFRNNAERFISWAVLKINPHRKFPPNWTFHAVRSKTICLSAGKKYVNIWNNVSN